MVGRHKGYMGLAIAMIVHYSVTAGHPLEQTGVRFMFHMDTGISGRTSSMPRYPCFLCSTTT